MTHQGSCGKDVLVIKILPNIAISCGKDALGMAILPNWSGS
jgi:hypothetical protein